MRLILFDAGRNRRMTAVDSIPPVVSGPWQARMPTPDFVLEGTGVDACLTVLSGREGVAGGGLEDRGWFGDGGHQPDGSSRRALDRARRAIVSPGPTKR